MTENSEKLYEALSKMHPDAKCELNYSTPFELLIAVVLSAQCTDKRVNKVTEELFKVANTAEDFAAMPTETLESMIFSCGFYKNKAKSIKDLSESIIELGEMPTTVDGLMKLRGVGKKTANVVYAEVFGGNAIAVDTHVFRVANRLGVAKGKTPKDVEAGLMAAFDENVWRRLHHLMIFQGRYICHSQKPACDECGLHEFCEYYKSGH